MQRILVVDDDPEIVGMLKRGLVYEGYSIELVLYEAHLRTRDLEPKRVKEYRWVAADEFGQYPFPPADRGTLDDFQLFVGSNKPKKLPTA